jgi:hypothetical protein
MFVSVPYHVVDLIALGMNTRPVVESLVSAGFTVAAADVFGDGDLRVAAELVLALADEEGTSDYDAGKLVALANGLAERTGCTTFVPTSGFDRDPKVLEGLKGEVLGTPPEAMRQAKDVSALKAIGIPLPRTVWMQDTQHIEEAAERIGFPCVVKPPVGSAGVGVRLVKHPDELPTWEDDSTSGCCGVPQDIPPEGFLVQEHVPGAPLSASFIADSERALLVGTNRQLLGEPWLGVDGYQFCGCISPAPVPEKVHDELVALGSMLAVRLGLLGSFGIDFAVRDGSVVVFEVNPRTQSTVDTLDRALDVSIGRLHVEACRGRLPDELPRPGTEVWGKAIVYARADGAAPKLSDVSDRPAPGTPLEQGEPVCTVLAKGRSVDDALSRLRERAGEVYRVLEGV